MTKEELLMPRFKVIADYPKSIYKVGEILPAGGRGEDLLFCDHGGPRMSQYPHLFKRLEWWEEREEKDLPQYFRHKDSVHKFTKVTHFHTYNNLKDVDIMAWNDKGYGPPAKECVPATKEEYINYMKEFEERFK